MQAIVHRLNPLVDFKVFPSTLNKSCLLKVIAPIRMHLSLVWAGCHADSRMYEKIKHLAEELSTEKHFTIGELLLYIDELLPPQWAELDFGSTPTDSSNQPWFYNFDVPTIGFHGGNQFQKDDRNHFATLPYTDDNTCPEPSGRAVELEDGEIVERQNLDEPMEPENFNENDYSLVLNQRDVSFLEYINSRKTLLKPNHSNDKDENAYSEISPSDIIELQRVDLSQFDNFERYDDITVPP